MLLFGSSYITSQAPADGDSEIITDKNLRIHTAASPFIDDDDNELGHSNNLRVTRPTAAVGIIDKLEHVEHEVTPSFWFDDDDDYVPASSQCNCASGEEHDGTYYTVRNNHQGIIFDDDDSYWVKGCRSCPSGKYKSSWGCSACSTCGVNVVGCGGSSSGSRCRAGTGYVGSYGCATCSTGKYNPGDYWNCLTCGSNTSGCGGASAGVCNPGYSSDDNGRTCTACSAGKYKLTTSNSDCNTCNINTIGCGGSSEGTCTSAYSSQGAGITCDICNIGYGRDITSGSIVAPCTACATNKYKSSYDNHQCTPCSIHAYSCGGVSPGICNAGYAYSNFGVDTCNTCDAGFSSSNTASTDSTMSSISFSCTPCLQGNYKSTIGHGDCTTCAENTLLCGSSSGGVCKVGYASAGNVVTCDTCAGGYTLSDTTKCSKCPPGSYKTQIGYDLCSICDSNSIGCAGNFAGVCPAGLGTTDNGATCTHCMSGMYKSEDGNGNCEACSIFASDCGGSNEGTITKKVVLYIVLPVLMLLTPIVAERDGGLAIAYIAILVLVAALIIIPIVLLGITVIIFILIMLFFAYSLLSDLADKRRSASVHCSLP